MATLYLCGAGNSEGVRLALGINRHQPRWDRIVLVDDDEDKHGRSLLGVKVVGPFSALADVDARSVEVLNLIARTTKKRRSAYLKIDRYGLPFASLIHPNVDTLGAELGRDVAVYQNATVGPEVTVGDGTVVFMGAAVGHECRVGNCCVVAANAVLNARVELGEGVYVGTNATVLPEIKIGPWATIGAGSVVIQDVPAGATVMGVPAEIISAPDAKTNGRPSPARTGTATGAAENPAVVADLERGIGVIFQQVLGVSSVEAEQNFFDSGGNSLAALQVREKVQRQIGRELALTEIFRFPTVRSLAQFLARPTEAAVGVPTNDRAELRRAAQSRRLQVRKLNRR